DRARAGERRISEEMNMLERRSFLTGAAALGALAPLASARAAFAAAPTDRRFVLVLLRGGLDGLHALPPHGDRDYRRLRPTLALSQIGRASCRERVYISVVA